VLLVSADGGAVVVGWCGWCCIIIWPQLLGKIIMVYDLGRFEGGGTEKNEVCPPFDERAKQQTPFLPSIIVLLCAVERTE
jgi:hypothetical protein